MTQLLVSVRDQVEALAALAGGADLLDVKEPALGSLGQAASKVIQECSDLAKQASVPCSAALGELLDCDPSVEARLQGATGLAFAKVGLAGAAVDPAWREKLQAFWRAAPPSMSPVAVVYADWRRARAPSPDEVFEAAAAIPCGVILVDTFQKGQGGLLDFLDVKAVHALIEASHLAEFRIVLAGSLGISEMAAVRELGADMIAVRGAVCRGSRTASIDVNLVRQVKRGLAVTSR